MNKQRFRMFAKAIVSDIYTLFRDNGNHHANANERSITLFSIMKTEIDFQKSRESIRTAETYASALHSFAKYRNGKDISICDFDSDIVMGYEAWLKRRRVTMNTVSFYMRRLRAAYNHALRKSAFADKHPFEFAYTGREETRKRALSRETMKALVKFEATTERQQFARDLFLFSYMTMGMSFVDIAYLRKSDIRNNYIIYNRRKTRQRLEIEVISEIREIIKRYPSSNDYLLPIIKRQGKNERNQVKYVQLWVNEALKEIGKQIDDNLYLTMYCARHTWATIARDENVPMALISRGLGHTSESTTRIYLGSISASVINHYNEIVVRAVMGR